MECLWALPSTRRPAPAWGNAEPCQKSAGKQFSSLGMVPKLLDFVAPPPPSAAPEPTPKAAKTPCHGPKIPPQESSSPDAGRFQSLGSDRRLLAMVPVGQESSPQPRKTPKSDIASPRSIMSRTAAGRGLRLRLRLRTDLAFRMQWPVHRCQDWWGISSA